jgi:hypothetical protein
MPTSPRQARARTPTNGQGCAVAAAPARFRVSSSADLTAAARPQRAHGRRLYAALSVPSSGCAGRRWCVLPRWPRPNRARSGMKHSPAPKDRPSPAPHDRAPASCRTAEPPIGALPGACGRTLPHAPDRAERCACQRPVRPVSAQCGVARSSVAPRPGLPIAGSGPSVARLSVTPRGRRPRPPPRTRPRASIRPRRPPRRRPRRPMHAPW